MSARTIRNIIRSRDPLVRLNIPRLRDSVPVVPPICGLHPTRPAHATMAEMIAFRHR